MKHLILSLFVVLLMVYPGMSQTIIVEDDFESYDTGTYPGEPWVTRYSGSSAEISEETAAEGLKSFKLVSNPSWARVEAVPLDSINDYMIYSGWVYVDQTDRGGFIGFGFTEPPSTYRGRNGVSFGSDANIRFMGNILQAYEAQTWYKVMVYCDFVRHMGKVWIDDVLMMEEVPLSTRDELQDFVLYGDNFAGDGTSTLFYDDVKLYVPEFKINNIADVPNDQGRQVRISWTAHTYDDVPGEGMPQVTEYSIWRQVDHNLSLHKGDMPGEWDFITTVPAVQDWEYHAIVPTLADSNINGMYQSTFFVRAHTEDILEHWETDPASGFSVDNLAPLQVSGALAENINDQEIQLSWDENPDTDFSHYNIYRGESAGFTAEEPLASTSSTSYVDDDVEATTYYYRISAVDFNGNEGDFSDEVSAQITGLEDAEGIVTSFALEQNYPNPFNPVTMINYQLPMTNEVDLSIYNVRGQKVATLVSEMQAAGHYQVEWNAVGFSSSTYYYVLQAGEFREIRKMILLR